MSGQAEATARADQAEHWKPGQWWEARGGLRPNCSMPKMRGPANHRGDNSLLGLGNEATLIRICVLQPKELWAEPSQETPHHDSSSMHFFCGFRRAVRQRFYCGQSIESVVHNFEDPIQPRDRDNAPGTTADRTQQ